MRALVSILVLLGACTDGLDHRSAGALAGECASCHEDQARALAASRHAAASSSPVFVALRAEAVRERGASMGGFCDGCHLPEPGITCVTCHAALGNRGTKNGLLLIDLDGPVRGPFAYPDTATPHAVQVTGFIESSDLCGTCHDVEGPPGFHEAPFAHWTRSPAAARGDTCQKCHMGSVPGDPTAMRRMGPAASLPDMPVRSLSEHHPIGLDDADPSPLMSAALDLTIEFTTASMVTVHVENRGDGHPLPVGASFLREIWVSLSVDEVEIEGATRWLSTRLTRGGVEVVSPALATEQVDNAIPPLGKRTFVIPAAAPRGARVEACVRLRRYRPDLLDHLGVSRDELGPVRDLACTTAVAP